MQQSELERRDAGGVSRRAVVTAAWSAPIIAMAVAAPAAAASDPPGRLSLVGMPYTPPGQSAPNPDFTLFVLTATLANGDPAGGVVIETGTFDASGWSWYNTNQSTNQYGSFTEAYPLIDDDWTRFAMRGRIAGELVTSNVVDRRSIDLTAHASTQYPGFDLLTATAYASPGVPAPGVAITVWLRSGGVWSAFNNSGTTEPNGTWSSLEGLDNSWSEAYISGTIDGFVINSNVVVPTS